MVATNLVELLELTDKQRDDFKSFLMFYKSTFIQMLKQESLTDTKGKEKSPEYIKGYKAGIILFVDNMMKDLGRK